MDDSVKRKHQFAVNKEPLSIKSAVEDASMMNYEDELLKKIVRMELLVKEVKLKKNMMKRVHREEMRARD